MMIRDLLVPRLKEEFAGWGLVCDVPPPAVAKLPARQAAVGSVIVEVYGNEAVVNVEHITHSHFDSPDSQMSEEERAEIIVDDVVQFLKALFDDRVLLYIGLDGMRGGWRRLDFGNQSVELIGGHNYYLWSKPYCADASLSMSSSMRSGILPTPLQQ